VAVFWAEEMSKIFVLMFHLNQLTMESKAHYFMLLSLYRDEFMRYYLTRDITYYFIALGFMQAASHFRSQHSLSGLS
jgi:hypothetical protein